jgi:hypothetical protein
MVSLIVAAENDRKSDESGPAIWVFTRDPGVLDRGASMPRGWHALSRTINHGNKNTKLLQLGWSFW